MNAEKINNRPYKSRILLSPLDWGLGHVTRCIPLISLLNKQNIEVIVAGEGPFISLLKKEFPGIVILPLKGYRVSYSKRGSRFFLKILLQLPKIIAAIIYEKRWLRRAVTDFNPTAIISDNRFGFYSGKIPSIFITHQLFIHTGHHFINRIAQKINYRYINKFSECWVPDTAGACSLAGALSHPPVLPQTPVKYLGILSRFKKIPVQKDIELLIMISGPEPQRSIFENMLLAQTENSEEKVVIIRGLPGTVNTLHSDNENISIFNHLPANELSELIQRSTLVIARCGYSTIMDLAVLKQKAILVPTPGQPEQEYLASYLKEKGLCYTTSQENFSLKQEREYVESFGSSFPGISPLINEDIIIDWLKKLDPGRTGSN